MPGKTSFKALQKMNRIEAIWISRQMLFHGTERIRENAQLLDPARWHCLMDQEHGLPALKILLNQQWRLGLAAPLLSDLAIKYNIIYFH